MGLQTSSEIARGKKIVAHGVAQQMIPFRRSYRTVIQPCLASDLFT